MFLHSRMSAGREFKVDRAGAATAKAWQQPSGRPTFSPQSTATMKYETVPNSQCCCHAGFRRQHSVLKNMTVLTFALQWNMVSGLRVCLICLAWDGRASQIGYLPSPSSLSPVMTTCEATIKGCHRPTRVVCIFSQLQTLTATHRWVTQALADLYWPCICTQVSSQRWCRLCWKECASLNSCNCQALHFFFFSYACHEP